MGPFPRPEVSGPLGRLLDVYYWQRVAITIAVERIVAYPDDLAAGEAEIFGRRRGPGRAAAPPRGGTERVLTRLGGRTAIRLPHTLLGWCGSDELPEVVPVGGGSRLEGWICTSHRAGSAGRQARRAHLALVPAADDRAGAADPHRVGDSDERRRALYSPHTKAGYRLPPSKALYTLGCAILATRMRAARKAGLAS